MYRSRVFPTSLRKYASRDTGGVSFPYFNNSQNVDVDSTSLNGPIVETSKNSLAFLAEIALSYAVSKALVVVVL